MVVTSKKNLLHANKQMRTILIIFFTTRATLIVLDESLSRPRLRRDQTVSYLFRRAVGRMVIACERTQLKTTTTYGPEVTTRPSSWMLSDSCSS